MEVEVDVEVDVEVEVEVKRTNDGEPERQCLSRA